MGSSERLARAGALLVACGLLAAPAAAAVSATAEIRIGLPEGAEPRVAVAPREGGLALDVPEGARYPSDFVAVSGGIVSEVQVTSAGPGRLRLDLSVPAGALEEVVWEPKAVVLRFASHAPPPEPTVANGSGHQYRLGPDDKVALSIHAGSQEPIEAQSSVTSDGLITAPLLGEVQAAGLSPRQLAAKLTDLLSRGGYLVQPTVNVEVVVYGSQWVMVAGEVQKPERRPLTGGTRLKEVLAEAGGFTPEAGEVIRISRRAASGGAPAMLEIARTDFEQGRQNPVLAHGDIIEVPLAGRFYVQGEVRQPDAYFVDRETTLLRAITRAGGLSEWADEKGVRVLYPEGVVPRERMFNLKKIKRGQAEDPPLSGGEVIIVGRRFL